MKTHRYILEITSQDGRVSLPDDDVIKEAIQYVLYVGQKASIVKVDLPEVLDEAAEECMLDIAKERDTDDWGHLIFCDTDIEDAFKAGAEWMAEQVNNEKEK